MPDAPGPNSETVLPAGSDRRGGVVIFLVEESTSMDARIAGGTKSKIESIATALNSLLNQLATEPTIDVGIVGYRANEDGQPDVGCRWAGTLAGRRLVPSSELAGAPVEVEDRVRKIPAAGGVGVAREETVRFPVWYVPRLGGAVEPAAAYAYCRQLLTAWRPAAGGGDKPPVIVSFVDRIAGPALRQSAAETRDELDSPSGAPLLFHAHLASSARVPATLYPSGEAQLAGPTGDLFGQSSPLPPPLAAGLKSLGVTVNAEARGLIYNAKMVDLIRFLSLVKTYARYRPQPGRSAPSGPEAS